MDIKSRQIKAINYYFLLCSSIFHLGFIIFLIFFITPSQFFPHLTNRSFLLTTLYLFSILLCDTCLYFFDIQKLEKYNQFIRNIISNIVFPYCFMISIGFWVILLIGFIFPTETFLKEGTKITVDMYFINFYVHLGITIIMIIELFLNEREKAKINWYYSVSNTVIYIVYVISICIEKYKYKFYAYVFLENLNALGMVLVGFSIYVLLIISYLIYYFLSNKINKRYIKVKESGEDEKLITGDDMNEENLGLNTEEE